MSQSLHPRYGNYCRHSQRAAAQAVHCVAPGAFLFGHGARQIRFGPIAFWSIVGALVIMAGWSLATATYFAFRDDVLARMIARQAHMQYAYEDRIAELRTQVDRLVSRQLLDQEQFEQKLEALIRRESVLESRAATLSALPDTGATGSIKPQRPSAPGERFSSDLSRHQPKGILALLPWTRLQPNATGIEAALARLDLSLNRIEARQANTLTALEENYGA